MNNEALLTIDHIQLFVLLLSYNTLLLSGTREGLQSLLDKQHLYRTRWNVTVNTDKSSYIFEKCTFIIAFS